MQPAGCVLLHDELPGTGRRRVTIGLGRLLEVAFGAVWGEWVHTGSNYEGPAGFALRRKPVTFSHQSEPSHDPL